MTRSTARLTLAMAAGMAGACSPPPEQESRTSDLALTENMVFPDSSCNDTARAAILSAATTARTLLYQRPGELIACLQQGFQIGPDTQASWAAPVFDGQPGRGTSYPEWLVWRLTQNMWTYNTCEDVGFAHARARPNLNFFEEIKWAKSWVEDPTTPHEDLVRVLLHELSHNKGAMHPYPVTENQYSMNLLIEGCVSSLLNGDSPAYPTNWPVRNELVQESLLSPVGIERGDGVVTECHDPDEFAAGIWGSADASHGVGRLGLTCTRSTPASDRDTSLVGTDGDAASFRTRCYPNEVMVGLWGQASATVSSVGEVCADRQGVLSGTDIFWNDPDAGAGGVLSWIRTCPAGMAVKQLRARVADDVHRLEIGCQRLSMPENIHAVFPSSAKMGGGGGEEAYTLCPGRSVMTGLALYPFQNVMYRATPLCHQVETKDGALRRWRGTDKLVMPGAGGGGFGQDQVNVDNLCPLGEALVGMAANVDAGVNGLAGICANITDWDKLQTGSVHTLASVGGTWGLWVQQTCAPGMFMVGWDTQSAQSLNSVQIACRRFGLADSGHPRDSVR